MIKMNIFETDNDEEVDPELERETLIAYRDNLLGNYNRHAERIKAGSINGTGNDVDRKFSPDEFGHVQKKLMRGANRTAHLANIAYAISKTSTRGLSHSSRKLAQISLAGDEETLRSAHTMAHKFAEDLNRQGFKASSEPFGAVTQHERKALETENIQQLCGNFAVPKLNESLIEQNISLEGILFLNEEDVEPPTQRTKKNRKDAERELYDLNWDYADSFYKNFKPVKTRYVDRDYNQTADEILNHPIVGEKFRKFWGAVTQFKRDFGDAYFLSRGHAGPGRYLHGPYKPNDKIPTHTESLMPFSKFYGSDSGFYKNYPKSYEQFKIAKSISDLNYIIRNPGEQHVPKSKGAKEFHDTATRISFKYPEVNAKDSKGGYFGDETFLERVRTHGMVWDSGYGGRLMVPATISAHSRAEAFLPHLQKYEELRDSGISHNDALDHVIENLDNMKDNTGKNERIRSILASGYNGNRSGPIKGKFDESVIREHFSRLINEVYEKRLIQKSAAGVSNELWDWENPTPGDGDPDKLTLHVNNAMKFIDRYHTDPRKVEKVFLSFRGMDVNKFARDTGANHAHVLNLATHTGKYDPPMGIYLPSGHPVIVDGAHRILAAYVRGDGGIDSYFIKHGHWKKPKYGIMLPT